MKECLDKKKTEYENEKTKIFQIFFSVLGFELSLLRFLWGLPPKSCLHPFLSTTTSWTAGITELNDHAKCFLKCTC
jgi:hypothetical protein